jgi:hypothetical protein
MFVCCCGGRATARICWRVCYSHRHMEHSHVSVHWWWVYIGHPQHRLLRGGANHHRASHHHPHPAGHDPPGKLLHPPCLPAVPLTIHPTLPACLLPTLSPQSATRTVHGASNQPPTFCTHPTAACLSARNQPLTSVGGSTFPPALAFPPPTSHASLCATFCTPSPPPAQHCQPQAHCFVTARTVDAGVPLEHCQPTAALGQVHARSAVLRAAIPTSILHGLQVFQQGVPTSPQSLEIFVDPHDASQPIAELSLTWNGTEACLVMDMSSYPKASPWRVVAPVSLRHALLRLACPTRPCILPANGPVQPFRSLMVCAGGHALVGVHPFASWLPACWKT